MAKSCFFTMECRNLFCFCYPRKWDSTQEICTKESTNKDFDHEKEIICCQSCQRKDSVSLCWKVDNRKENIFETKENFRKYDTQNLRTKEGIGEETTNDRGLRPIRSSHNTIFTTHAIWFFTTLSGWVFFFSMVGTSLCITTGTKNETYFFRKMKVKEDTKNRR